MVVRDADLMVKIAGNNQQVQPVSLVNSDGKMLASKRLPVQTLLNAVGATGESDSIDLSDYNNVKLQIIKSGTATVDVQESLDGTNYDVSLSDQDGIVSISQESFAYLLVDVSAFTSGTVSVFLIAGS